MQSAVQPADPEEVQPPSAAGPREEEQRQVPGEPSAAEASAFGHPAVALEPSASELPDAGLVSEAALPWAPGGHQEEQQEETSSAQEEPLPRPVEPPASEAEEVA